MSFVVSIQKVSKTYMLGQQQVPALIDVDLAVLKGEFLAIAGPSGSGKSTLLNLIGCIDNPTEGTISIDQVDVSNQSPDQLADLRALKIGFIFQSFNLLPVLSAFENIEYPLHHFRISKEKRKERVMEYLEMVGIADFAKHRPNQLSGGQRQRVAIARALITQPVIVLADEPTANLDHRTGESILHLMKEINRVRDTTFIFSTHDPRVMELADRVVKIEDGRIM